MEIVAIKNRAGTEAEKLASDPFWMAGVVLYWAEGSKTGSQLSVTNADLRALTLFSAWVRKYLDKSARFSLQLHLHEGNDDEAARAYWKVATGLTQTTFHKTYVKPAGTGHRKNTLTHGVCRVRVAEAADHWNRVMAWVDHVAERMPPLVEQSR